MFAVPMFQIFALRKRENFVRTAAYSGEPIERHLRLNEDQFDQLVANFHQWREEHHVGNGGPGVATSNKMVKTFLHLGDFMDKLDIGLMLAMLNQQ